MSFFHQDRSVSTLLRSMESYQELNFKRIHSNFSSRILKANSFPIDFFLSLYLFSLPLTGQCKRRLSCPYKHDSEKVAICPGILRPTGCTRAVGTCMLSHQSTFENTPHCVHFLRFGSCRLGEDCLYSKGHTIGIASDGPICRDFNVLGWCSKGKDCRERHTWECKDFNENGKCSKEGCRLLHVEKNRGNNNGKKAQEEKLDFSMGDGASSLILPGNENQIQDGDLFVRDDAADQEEEEEDTSLEEEDQDQEEEDSEEELEQDSNSRKRKRGLLESGAFSKVGDDEGASLSFVSRKKKAKEFTAQDDFVGFDDLDDEEEEDEEGGGEGLEVGSDEESIASEVEEDDSEED